MTDPDEQARCAFTAKDHADFQASGMDSEREFLRVKYDAVPSDYDSVGEFIQATAGDATVEFAAASDATDAPDDVEAVGERAMTVNEKLDFQESAHTDPAEFLQERHGLNPEAFASSSAYQRAVAERGE